MERAKQSQSVSQSSSQFRKHSKTFTGCWTCRTRKVKCDEEKPECSQCRFKGFDCQGYEIRLRWMPLSNDEVGRDQGTCVQGSRTRTQRSRIFHEPRERPLQDHEINGILNHIDTFGNNHDSSKHVYNSSLLLHNFGVFQSSGVQPAKSTSQVTARDSAVASLCNSPICSFTGDEAELDHSQRDGNGNEAVPDSLDTFDQYLYSDQETPSDGVHISHVSTGVSEVFNDLTDVVIYDKQDECSEEINLFDAHPVQYRWQTSSGPIIYNPTPYRSSKLEHFLIYHYAHRVVQLFCIFDNKKTPWQTIHLPRALQSIGQLAVQGSSSRIRDALRNALFSISAFCLSNDSHSRQCDDEAARWAKEATIFRGKAIQLLKDAVENGFHDKKMPKYKDCLATMLSMISINVMSGDTSTCGIHLDGALRYMSHVRTWKVNYSPKARSLHRIYFYLRTIYESTSLRKQSEIPRLARLFSSKATQPSHSYPMDALELIEDVSSQDSSLTSRMTTYEYIYGVPQSLLVLMSHTTELINQLTEFREKEGNHMIPEHLAARCDELEKDIMDWPIDLELQARRADDESHNSDIICETTCAFHNALIIYFAQHIRLMQYRYLQSYVQAVLESIETIERIKAERHVLAAPLYWPVFIAASEAFDDRLQKRFIEWYDMVTFYGIAAVRTGISVLNEVWDHGPATHNRITSQWRTVVERRGICLMLS